MSNDPLSLVERLDLLRFRRLDRRNCDEESLTRLAGEAADEIERLTRELESWKATAKALSDGTEVIDAERDRLRAALEKAAEALEHCRYSEKPLARELRTVLAGIPAPETSVVHMGGERLNEPHWGRRADCAECNAVKTEAPHE